MTLKAYIKFALLLTAIDAIILSYFYSASLGDELSRPFLVAKGVLDVFFILGNWKNFKSSRLEIVLISVLAIHTVAGLVVMPMFSTSYLPGRAANDVIWPILFLFKIVIFRNLIEKGGFSTKDLKYLVRIMLYLSVVQIAIFVIFSRISGAYAGIAPPTNLPLSYGLAFSQPWMIVTCVIVILLSGKRSFLLGALVAVGVRALVQRKNRAAFLALGAFAIIVIVGSIGGAAAGILPQDISDKLKQAGDIFGPIGIAFRDGPSALLEDAVRHELYVSTAGRSEEFFSIFSVMSWYNLFVGLGAGFTYSYLHWEGWVDGYANSHFSPLALTYKFGIIYAGLLYWYVSKGILRLVRTNDGLSCMVAFGLVMFLVQSLFAFNLFVELFFPLLIALRQVAEKTMAPVWFTPAGDIAGQPKALARPTA